MNEPLDNLLTQLCSGDMAAAEQVFLAFEPYLRKAVRRQLPASFRAKFDSADILQSVWADVLRGVREAGWRFIDADHLRGFLFIATRNRLIDRMRQHQKAVEYEEPLGEGDGPDLLPSPQPCPSDIAQAEDLWQRILGLWRTVGSPSHAANPRVPVARSPVWPLHSEGSRERGPNRAPRPVAGAPQGHCRPLSRPRRNRPGGMRGGVRRCGQPTWPFEREVAWRR